MSLLHYARIWRGSRFTEAEAAVLQAVAARLSAPAADQFRKQVDSIVMIQRHLDGREVCCYPSWKYPIVHNPNLQFANKSPELRLATVSLSTKDAATTWRADVYLVEGQFFSIVFIPSPKGIQGPYEVVNVVMHADPMRPSKPITPVAIEVTDDLARWVHEQLHIDAIREVRQPLSENQRMHLLDAIDAVLPKDYLALLDRCDGFFTDDWTVIGASEVYSICTKGGDFYVLAEFHDSGVVMVRARSRDASLYFGEYEGITVQCGSTLGEAVRAVYHGMDKAVSDE